jgi:hypothetical protein
MEGYNFGCVVISEKVVRDGILHVDDDDYLEV